MIAITEEMEKIYKADPRFKKHNFLGPLYEGQSSLSNHTSTEGLRLPATRGKNVIRLF